MNTKERNNFQNQLNQWYERAQRSLPWRDTNDPYKIWVSEVMLQQTQVQTVIPYFEKFIKQFPDLESLAKAGQHDLLKAWEGLGYYSWARNLHRAAKGMKRLPETRAELEAICGLGPYTAGAILSFAFKKRAAALDGNVQRVLSRVLNFGEDLSKLKNQRILFEWLETHLPDVQPWVAMEGLIELGATVCGKRARCGECPLRNECKGRARADRLPVKSKKVKITLLHRRVYLIEAEGCFLVQRGEVGKVMEGLYEFPYCERECEEKPLVTHHFTRFRVYLYPEVVRWDEKIDVMGYEWVKREDLAKLPFSSGHKRIYEAICHGHALRELCRQD